MTVARLLTALLVGTLPPTTVTTTTTFDVPHVSDSSAASSANDIVTVIDSIFRN